MKLTIASGGASSRACTPPLISTADRVAGLAATVAATLTYPAEAPACPGAQLNRVQAVLDVAKVSS
jgi:hypothetical protein